jgi:anhydro-N-acetylmuramic acid kinase
MADTAARAGPHLADPLYIGLMSGTSLDGVDGVLAAFPEGGRPQVAGFQHRAMPAALREELRTLNRRGGADELHRAALAGNALSRLYAEVVAALLADTGVAPTAVRAVGAHGQTVRHQPGAHDGTGYTLQLLNGALLAERCGIPVVCDLRSRDLAAGGQGAPLVSVLHAACLADPACDVAVLNLGGIANLTLLPAGGPVLGFDCGPGNVLMDLWTERHRGARFDADGAWAASGLVDPTLLRTLLADPYFALPPPKSTGRDLFDAEWLDARLPVAGRQRSAAGDPAAADVPGLIAAPAAQDVMASLLALTAESAAQALLRHLPGARALHVCGGGAFNARLMQALAAALPAVAVQSTAASGLPPDQVEALAFAWLARACLNGQAGNVPSVTGARGPRVLGAIYPA